MVQEYSQTNYAKTALSVLATFAVVIFLISLAAPRSRADDERAKCQRRIEKAEAKFHEAIEKHGDRSDDAKERRRDLITERQACWDRFHEWWDGREQRWHDDKDWDHDLKDHDRDHDHDRPQP